MERGRGWGAVGALTVFSVWKIVTSPETMKRMLQYSKHEMLQNIKVIACDYPGYTIYYRLPDVMYIKWET